jgi:hypothetical protein
VERQNTAKSQRFNRRARLGVLIALAVIFIGSLVLWLIENRRMNFEHRRVKTGPPFEAGNLIIEKLNAYKAAHETYPDTLNKLVPDFLERIPFPGWGEGRWDYLADESRFILSVRKSKDDYIGHYYSSESRQWYFDN